MADLTFDVSPAEWAVLRIVWTLDGADTGTIVDALVAKRGWAPATIKTLLGRLVKKGALTTTKDGRQFHYTATIGEQDSMHHVLQAQVAAMCAMKVGSALTQTIADMPLSKDDITNLVEVLNQKLATAPAMVECDCLPASMRGVQHEGHC
ncbi:CopY/TcrY family copper transport repressor [Lacticaseibacillus pantheris]|jgi:CopY/TcrY family copper transport repressor|nr:CopY/TcrY family copper transport repressor [Lacticaseibacillus pantheris]